MMARACRELGEAHSAQLPPQALAADRDTEFLPQPPDQVHEPPVHHAIQTRLRPVLHCLRQRRALIVDQ